MARRADLGVRDVRGARVRAARARAPGRGRDGARRTAPDAGSLARRGAGGRRRRAHPVRLRARRRARGASDAGARVHAHALVGSGRASSRRWRSMRSTSRSSVRSGSSASSSDLLASRSGRRYHSAADIWDYPGNLLAVAAILLRPAPLRRRRCCWRNRRDLDAPQSLVAVGTLQPRVAAADALPAGPVPHQARTRSCR